MPEYAGEGTILIVEDEKVVADSLAQILCSRGYDARIAYSAESALQLVAQFAPSLAILDVMLPKMNGIDLGVILKERFATCHILLFSGQPTVEALMKKAKSEGHEFEIMAKPVHPTVLLEAIAKRLSANRVHQCQA